MTDISGTCAGLDVRTIRQYKLQGVVRLVPVCCVAKDMRGIASEMPRGHRNKTELFIWLLTMPYLLSYLTALL